MKTELEDLRILQTAQEIADSLWSRIVKWDDFSKDTVGKQLAPAADSIGANIAEAFGRFHYGQKIEFLYYARGSLFETKYWLNRVMRRSLMPVDEIQRHSRELTSLARGLNAFVKDLRAQQKAGVAISRTAREEQAEYMSNEFIESKSLFTDEELTWLESLNLLSPVSNLSQKEEA